MPYISSYSWTSYRVLIIKRIGSVKIKVKLDLYQRVHLVEKHLPDFVSVIEVVDIVVHCADIMAPFTGSGKL